MLLFVSNFLFYLNIFVLYIGMAVAHRFIIIDIFITY